MNSYQQMMSHACSKVKYGFVTNPPCTSLSLSLSQEILRTLRQIRMTQYGRQPRTRMTVKKCLAASTLWRKKKVTRKLSLRKSAQHILTADRQTDRQTDGRTFFTMELSGCLGIPVVYSRFFTRESPLISFISFRHVDT